MFHNCFSHSKQLLKCSPNSNRLCNGFTQGVLTSLVESIIVSGENFSHSVFMYSFWSEVSPSWTGFCPTVLARTCNMYLHRGANLTSFCAYIMSFNDHRSQKMLTRAKILLISSKLKLMD